MGHYSSPNYRRGWALKPYLHSKVSVGKWGGAPEDYLSIHDFIDSSKAFVPDMRHRIFLHSSWGVFLCERIFGTFITNQDGKKVQVRDVAEQHIIDDMGCIPTPQDYLDGLNPLDKNKRSAGLPMLEWLGGPKRAATRTINMTTD
jgi:hypothetical protein